MDDLVGGGKGVTAVRSVEPGNCFRTFHDEITPIPDCHEDIDTQPSPDDEDVSEPENGIAIEVESPPKPRNSDKKQGASPCATWLRDAIVPTLGSTPRTHLTLETKRYEICAGLVSA